MRLLIISNNQIVSTKLKQTLKSNHFNVDLADSEQRGAYWARTTDYDLVLIVQSSGVNILKITKELRSRDKLMPILALTRETDTIPLVEFYESGVDDCASIFCCQAELIARVKALLRRPHKLLPDIFKIDDLTLNTKTYQVTRGSKSIYLTKKEFSLLEYLLRNKEIVLSRSEIIEHVWDINADLFSNTLETHILNLRKKIENPRKAKLIHTISGRGYKIALPA